MKRVFTRQRDLTIEEMGQRNRDAITRPNAQDKLRTMTNAQLAQHYIREAKRYEDAATLRKMQIRLKMIDLTVIHYQATGVTPTQEQFDAEVTHRTEAACSGTSTQPGDPSWKGKVAMNQWCIQQAIMFGIAAMNDKNGQHVVQPRTSST